jgi:hypothetical protein
MAGMTSATAASTATSMIVVTGIVDAIMGGIMIVVVGTGTGIMPAMIVTIGAGIGIAGIGTAPTPTTGAMTIAAGAIITARAASTAMIGIGPIRVTAIIMPTAIIATAMIRSG